VNSRCAPKRILTGQALNEIATRRINAWSSRTSRAAPPAANEPSSVPSVDGGRLNDHQRRATLATPVARLATQQTVRWLEALIRTCPNGQLVSHRKYFEQEVSTRRQCKSDGSEGLNDVLHRAQHGRLLCQSLVLPGRNIGDGQARNELRWNSCRAHGPDRIFSDYT